MKAPGRRGLRSIRHRVTTAALALVVLLGAAGCGSAAHFSSGTTARAPDEVLIRGFAFVPRTITVKAGATVTWVNEDVAVHNIVADHGTFPSSTDLNQGQKYSHTFNTPGTYRYICGLHTFMTGTVVVTG